MSSKFPFAELPAELLASLHQAAEAIDVERTNDLLGQVRLYNERLADNLAELIRNYRFDLLQKLLMTGDSES